MNYIYIFVVFEMILGVMKGTFKYKFMMTTWSDFVSKMSALTLLCGTTEPRSALLRMRAR